MVVLWLIAATVIFLTIAVLVYMVPGSALTKVSDYSSWTLNQIPQGRLDSTYVDTFMKNESSTLRVFYYIQGLPRTSVVSDDTPTIAPNLNPITNNYDICDNTNGACVHKGFIKLLTFGNSFLIELLEAPDASRPNLPKTQVCIQTVKNTSTGNTNYIETFPIPPLPMQKWVMITVSRQGHRFDIYYNDTLQTSIKTTNAPYFTATNGTLADTSVRGVAKNPKVMNTFSRPEQVQGDYSAAANTKGEPYDSILPIALPSLCPSGDCFSGPTVKPANPLVDWKTDFM
jgi:hypothetical protein